jgi:hypothetical protein
MSGFAGIIGAVLVLGAAASHDSIDAAVSEVRANPFFGNGIHRSFSLPPDAKDSEIIATAYPTLNFPDKQPQYLILEKRTATMVTVPGPVRAVLLRTGDQNIVCFLQYSPSGWVVDTVPE